MPSVLTVTGNNVPSADAVRHRIDSLVKELGLPAAKQARGSRHAGKSSKAKRKNVEGIDGQSGLD